MVRSYKCSVDVTIHSISAPGTWLLNRDDVYVTIELFNQVKRTRLVDPIFPLLFHDRFSFEKIFWTASDPLEVTEILEDLPVVIELRQVTDVYLGGALLAYFDSSVRDFLSPFPSSMPRFMDGREIIMCRTVDFTGMSPKLQFSTYTVIERHDNSFGLTMEVPFKKSVKPRISRDQRDHQRRSSFTVDNSYDRQTVSSALRSRSPSPEIMLAKQNPVSSLGSFQRVEKRSSTDLRPPFVVRKVDPSIILRQPKFHDNYKVVQQKKKKKRRSRSASPLRNIEDDEVSKINRNTASPLMYYPSLRERYSPLLNSTSDRISDMVHSAQYLNASQLAY